MIIDKFACVGSLAQTAQTHSQYVLTYWDGEKDTKLIHTGVDHRTGTVVFEKLDNYVLGAIGSLTIQYENEKRPNYKNITVDKIHELALLLNRTL